MLINLSFQCFDIVVYERHPVCKKLAVQYASGVEVCQRGFLVVVI